ncbi:aminodeoxychorismate synthase component I [Thalassoroseus pseudoceratinae]|uniref:aminodeoxychorismate synthase component I n=1 Tax=Thalassoroseus pseudoceratinae TaxID=2713176 RepID=UPI001420FE93|nr:aminodeoxychorismate synthase component I [Thalassoroseus pseudoceratinae]
MSASISPAREFPLVHELGSVPDVSTVARAFADWPHLAVLESVKTSPALGRYSYVTADPIRCFQRDRVRFGEEPLEPIWSQLATWSTPPQPDLPPFQGGAIGLLGYELGGAWERIPRAHRDEFQIPDLAVGIYDWVIAWDHHTDQAWIISQGLPNRTDDHSRQRRSQERMSQVLSRLKNATAIVEQPLSANSLVPEAQHTLENWPSVTSNFSSDQYLRAVERVIEYINAGDIFQANLSQRLLAAQSCSPLELYARLRQSNPAPFAGFFRWDDWFLASASPERFVQINDGFVETRPIKGTRRRRSRPEADLYSAAELKASEKDQAENVMIVDLLRNDLSRVCEAGSIRVPQLCQVESFETVQHLVSVVQGRLKAGLSAADLIRASFPGGSITGAPKIRAMEIIAELETTVRGPYCGNLFWAGLNGAFDSNILIRTFVGRHGWLQCSVGGGIVAQSTPQAEYEETWHKAEGMLRALP